ncbi:MAG: hypothetical protein ACRCUT_03085, partial [Spirochaetota bacterium]
VFKLDIAEIRINGDSFANNRNLFEIPISDSASFFNGNGVEYQNDDPKPNRHYSKVNIYLRKMILDNANVFTIDTGTFKEKVETVFSEEKTNGFDLIPSLVSSKYDSQREELTSTNRVFPLDVPISGGFETDGARDAVLEVRLVIKNYLKRYEFIDYDDVDDVYVAYHAFGISDWMRDVWHNESYYQGGNLVSVARGYHPDQTGTISGTATAGRYVAAIPADETLTNYTGHPDRPGIFYAPVKPTSLTSDINIAYIQYYAEYEKYKDDHHNYYQIIYNTYEDYTSTWTAYEEAMNNFKIPPVVTYSSDGSYTLENVPVGEPFKIYYSDETSVPGELPEVWNLIGTATVSAAGSDVSPL